jgi:hypothetical protein
MYVILAPVPRNAGKRLNPNLNLRDAADSGMVEGYRLNLLSRRSRSDRRC